MDKRKVFDEKFNNDIYKSEFYKNKIYKLHNTPITKKLVKYLQFLQDNCTKKLGDLSVRGYYSLEPLSFMDKTMGDQLRLSIGSCYAKKPFDCVWLNLSGSISESINPEDVVFNVDIGGEGIVVDNEGNNIQAISNYSCDYDDNFGIDKKTIVLNNNFISNGQISFWLDYGYNKLGKNTSTINKLDVLLVNKKIAELYYDLQVILAIYNFSSNSYMQVIEAKLNNLGLFDILELTNENIEKIKDTFNQILQKENFDEVFNITAVGTASQDIGWLCPLRESYRKLLRAYTNQMFNLNLYDDYVFGASYAQNYKIIKDKNPKLFEQIKQKVKENRWEILGTSWVNANTNLIGGESLIRQIYYGKKFFTEEFNINPSILMLNQSDNISTELPQIMNLSNTPYLLINQLTDNNLQTFNYVGIDNSKVITHCLSEESKNSPVSVARMKYLENTSNDTTKNNGRIMLYGMSNGGYGAGFEHLERAKRLKNVQPLPKLKLEKAVNFFERLNAKNTKLEECLVNECVSNKYSGGNTTVHYVKYFNRKVEILLRNYELLIAQLGLKEEDLPISHSDLEEIWKEVLLYQSDKIISGDASNKSYEEIIVKYDVIFNKLKYSITELLKNCKTGSILYNPNSFEYEHTYKYMDKWYSQTILPFSIVDAEKGNQITAYYGIAGENHIENKNYKIVFNNGEIVSIYDKYYNKEFVNKSGSMCLFEVYKDTGSPIEFATDFEKNGASMRCVGFETVKNGPTVSANITLKKGKIKVEEVVSITDGKVGVDVSCKISFYSKNKMLVTSFSSNIEASKCSANTQFGYNTSKVDSSFTNKVADKFIDISNSNYGLTLITDCKYGYVVNNSDIKVCLIRSPKQSDYRIDNGNMEVKMQILPHHSSMDINSYKQAYIVNNPIIEATGNKKTTIKKLCSSNENVIIEYAKTFSDGKVVVRAYNATNKKQTANITFGRRIQKKIVDIMDNKVTDVKGELIFKPFELINILFD